MLRLLILFTLLTQATFAQEATFKLFLVGDAGEDEMTGETLDSVKSKLHSNPNSAIVFLGDNCYRDIIRGIIPGYRGFDSSKVTQKKILSQLHILEGYHGSVFFVPGNHDWWNANKFTKGKRKLRMEELFIQKNLAKNLTIKNSDETVFQPNNGSPGPASVELDNKKIKLIFIDTEWFLMLGFKRTPVENLIIEKQFYHNLDSVLADAYRKGQKIIVTGHHPVYTEGGLNKPLKHPGFMKRLKFSYTTSAAYKHMAENINAIFKKYPDLIYASGHVHALQYFSLNGLQYIVSGSGSKTFHVSKKYLATHPQQCDDNKCMLWNEKGFYEIDFSTSTEKVIMYHNDGKESKTF